MKKIYAALLAALLLLGACCAAAAGAAAPAERVGVILYVLDADDRPLANTTVLLQETLDSDDAYEGTTDRQGIMMIPSFPLTGFIMAVRNADNALAGLADVTLYPGTETRIMNNPHPDDDSISLETLRSSKLSEHINGNAPLEIAGGADSIPMYHYEVQISEAAGGVGALFRVGSGNTLALEGVSDGAPGAIIPEPTLPPDDDAALPPASASPPPAPATTAPATTAPATAVPSTETPSATQTDAGPSATSEPPASPSPSAEPSASASAEPSVTPTREPTPTPAPPSPSASATTASDLINVKLFLKNSAGEPMAYYRTRLNGSVDAAANGEGEAYYTNVTTNVTHELAVYNPEGGLVGTCGLRFVEGQSTSVASVNTGSSYTIDYQQGTQDVYVELVVDEGDVSAAEASAQPSQAAQQSSGGTAAAQSQSPASAQASEDVIGTPSEPESAAQSGPGLTGYFSDEAGTAIAGATIRLRNEDTKALSSAITTAEGTFTISQLPPGNYSIGALSPQGRNLGEVQFTAARGTKTRLKTSSNGTTYLSEAQDSDTVFVDLRELSNGRLDMLYAAASPMAAPAVPKQEAASAAAVVNPPLVVEEIEETTVAEPEPAAGNMSTILIIAGLCAAGLITAIVLMTRHARIR